MASNPAPGELELVRAFVNTWDAEDRSEHLPDAAALRAWLAERNLLAPSGRVTASDHERALEVREALRAMLFAHAGLELDPDAPATIDAAARRARLAVRFGGDGTAHVEAQAGGADGALGRLLAIVAAAMEDGTWERLKVCLADDCQWAYFDNSRNRSAVWCDMRVCGNRRKVRSYRQRHIHPAAGRPS
jgi:predicted RNA-binding Zn ribbon-like protein